MRHQRVVSQGVWARGGECGATIPGRGTTGRKCRTARDVWTTADDTGGVAAASGVVRYLVLASRLKRCNYPNTQPWLCLTRRMTGPGVLQRRIWLYVVVMVQSPMSNDIVSRQRGERSDRSLDAHRVGNQNIFIYNLYGSRLKTGIRWLHIYADGVTVGARGSWRGGICHLGILRDIRLHLFSSQRCRRLPRVRSLRKCIGSEEALFLLRRKRRRPSLEGGLFICPNAHLSPSESPLRSPS